MQIFTLLLVGILLSSASFVLLEDEKKATNFIKKFLLYTFFYNIIMLSIFKYILNMPYILDYTRYNLSLSLKYIAFSLIAGLLLIFIKKMLVTRYNLTKDYTAFSKKSFFVKLLMTLFFIIGSVFIYFSNWFIDYFGEITTEQFLFNLNSPLKGTSTGMVTEIIFTPVFAIVSTTVLFLIFINLNTDRFLEIKDKTIKVCSAKLIKILSWVLSLVILVGGVAHGVKKLHLNDLVVTYFSTSNYFEKNYVDPRKTEMTFPEKKRNLIHIYLESMENSYLSKDLGGYMDENIMPELTELTKEGVHFSHNDKFGGANQTYGSSWSVAGMVNMSAGIPLKVSTAKNKYGLDGQFLPGTVTIGDILAAKGYNQTIMFGADADFGGLTAFFTSHGKFNIFDSKAARAKKLVPPGYFVWWGFEDEKLYEFAKDELTRLHNEGKPFNFTMETADTHFPDGYMTDKVEKKYPEQYANVIAHSTKEAVKFVRWIQQQPFYENTTVVITGDHLSMDKKFFKDFDPRYRRSTFNLILNSPVKPVKTTNREFAPYDMFPTILSSMDVQISGDRLGLGTNLFSDKKTIIERDGTSTVNTAFEKKSDYFDNEFLSPLKNSTFKTDKAPDRKGN